MPEPDRHFEYDPDWLEATVKDWDKDNPAKVIHIEAPSTPDPSNRMSDESIRFSANRSKKYIKDSFKFVTDREIDDQAGLFKVIRAKGYYIAHRKADYIRSNYGEKIGRIAVPEEAVIYFISVSPEIANIMREKNPDRPVRLPDRQRKVEDIEEWNRVNDKYKLGTLEGFKKYINRTLNIMFPMDSRNKYRGFKQTRQAVIDKFKKDNNISASITSYDGLFDVTETSINTEIRQLLDGPFGKNKHALYSAQQVPITERWVSSNVIKPAYNQILKRISEGSAKEQIKTNEAEQKRMDANRAEAEEGRERRRKEDKEKDIQDRYDERNQPRLKRPERTIIGSRKGGQGAQAKIPTKKKKTPNLQINMQLSRMQRQLDSAKSQGNTERVNELENNIKAIKDKIGKMDWKYYIKR